MWLFLTIIACILFITQYVGVIVLKDYQIFGYDYLDEVNVYFLSLVKSFFIFFPLLFYFSYHKSLDWYNQYQDYRACTAYSSQIEANIVTAVTKENKDELLKLMNVNSTTCDKLVESVSCFDKVQKGQLVSKLDLDQVVQLNNFLLIVVAGLTLGIGYILWSMVL